MATLVSLEGLLRLAGRHSAALRTLLYLPSLATSYEDVPDTRSLLATTPLGFSPGIARDAFVLNSRGFRTPEYDEGPVSQPRVVALGDSFTFGAVREGENWTRVLERRLREDYGDGSIEVISLGVPAVGPDFYRRLWQLEGEPLAPDVVLVAFFVGNDFVDGGLEPPDSRAGFWARHSLAVRALRNGARLLRGGGSLERGPTLSPDAEWGREDPRLLADYDPSLPTYVEGVFLDMEWRRLAILRREERDWFHSQWRRVRLVLADLLDSIERSGARPVVVIIPDQGQVDDALRSQLLGILNRSSDAIALGYPQTRLKRFLDERGVEYLDLLPVLRADGRGAALYKLRDSHWNALGNEVAAESLAERFLEHGWLLEESQKPGGGSKPPSRSSR